MHGLAVLALITKLDGANAMLFHVEHCDNRAWEYQIRWPESRASEYRSWQEVKNAVGDFVVVPLMDPTVACEVRWRWNDWIQPEDSPPWEEEWHDAVPREWGETPAEFHVIVKQPRDFATDPVVQAVALVRGMPSAFLLTMPRRKVAQDGVEVLTVPGMAHGVGPSTVLREAGEFVCTNDVFSVSNSGSSQVTLLAVQARPPEALPFTGFFAVKLGTLPPEEIEILRAYVAEQSNGSGESD